MPAGIRMSLPAAKRFEAVVLALLWCSLYREPLPGGALGTLLVAGGATLAACSAYFLRIWLSVFWTQTALILFLAAAAQGVWLKANLEPWWVLAVCGLVFPAVENLRAGSRFRALLLQCLMFPAASGLFFFLRGLLLHSPWNLLAEHAAAVFLVLGFLAFAAQASKRFAEESS